MVLVDDNGPCRRRRRRWTRVGVVFVVVRSRRGRGVVMIMLGRMRLVVRGGARSGGVLAAVGSRECGCADCGACEARDQEFLEVVVHIAHSLSFLDAAQEGVSRLHPVRHKPRQLLTKIFAMSALLDFSAAVLLYCLCLRAKARGQDIVRELIGSVKADRTTDETIPWKQC